MKTTNLLLFWVLSLLLAFTVSAQLPLKYGQAVVTCGTGDIWAAPAIPGPNEPAVATKDVRNRPPFSTGNWAAAAYNAADWVYGTVDGTGKKTDKLGTVFGLCIDTDGDMYVTSYSGFNSISYAACDDNYQTIGPKGLMPYGFGGPGAIYKLNGTTGAVTLFAVLPQQDHIPMFKSGAANCITYTDSYSRTVKVAWADASKTTGPGLGNIAFDKDHNQFFVTNFEDGKIYRLSSTGAVLDSFDPMNPDDGLPGFAPIGERIYGIGYYNSRVYYSVWAQDRGTNTQNTIRSVSLNSTGEFLNATDQLEIIVAHPSGYNGKQGGDGQAWVMDPISDIEFSHNGKMLISEQSRVTDISERGHSARGLEYTGGNGSWTLAHTYYVGAWQHTTNSAGGIDYGYKDFDISTNSVDLSSREQFVWVSGDAIRLQYDCISNNTEAIFLYGMQGILQTGNASGCPAAVSNSNLVDFDGNLTENTKGYIGDVDVFREAGCVKPNAGPDAAAICQPTNTVTLTPLTTGGIWTAQTGNPAVATITGDVITGLSTAGTYKFIYSVTGGGITCSDTAQVVVNAKPIIANGTATICAGETVDLTSKITNYAAFLSPAWTTTTAGGTAVATPTAVKPTGTTTYVLVAQNALGCKDTANVVVTVNPKPNAGNDQTLVCANAGTNTLTTSTTLVPTPTGGTYTQIGTAPAAAIITGNAVSGMNVAGTYQFVYTLNDCKDTVAVTVQPCAGCVKPNAGLDITLTCPPTGITLTTATLVPVTTGGTWAVQAGNPATATIDAGGNITGLSTAGTYKFIYSITGGGQVCTDTVHVIVPTCVQPKGSLGDFVWKDTNNNGIQDETGTGVSGVILELYKNGLATGIKDTTDATGKYLFSIADSASYQVKIVDGVPAGCLLSTKQNVSTGTGNDTNDSDFNPATGLSDAVTVNPANPLKKDVLTVDAALYSPCVKPNAGTDQALVCAATVPTTADLTDAATGQKWKVLSVQPGTAVTVTTPTGTVTGMTVPGTYRFVLQTQADSLTCRDTVSVIVPNCACPTVNVVTPNATVCKDSLFPTLQVAIVGTNTSGVSSAWYANAAGGNALSTGLSYKPASLAAVTDTFYVQLTGVTGNCIAEPRTPVIVTVQNCAVEIDLALKKLISSKQAKVGDEIEYRVKVWNESNTNATGVEVADSLNSGVQYISSSATRGSYDPATKKWTIGNIAANGDTVTLTIKVKVLSQGLWFNTAEISKTNEKDKDSTPDNGNDNEDDIDRQCFTAPIKLCQNEKVEAAIPVSYTGVKWFKNGLEITSLAGLNTVLLEAVGTYTFTANNGNCPTGGCCPIIIESGDNCCPTQVCVPFTIKKLRK